ncbi:hypothetical protein PsorP6_006857 [Peronosclerospora sorghi]|uniref:Uncharacterized protein n=1 Tax=Peronosclerospora sorghi TaxID=230839 RepID=A0ACC0WC66_9STRA|nr:hypothetical protein PsorP6_006857 [Peronosclerospora sorghi]
MCVYFIRIFAHKVTNIINIVDGEVMERVTPSLKELNRRTRVVTKHRVNGLQLSNDLVRSINFIYRSSHRLFNADSFHFGAQQSRYTVLNQRQVELESMMAVIETRGSFCIPARRMRPMRPVPITAKFRRLDSDENVLKPLRMADSSARRRARKSDDMTLLV